MIRNFVFGMLVFSSVALCNGLTRIVLPSGDSGYSVTCENSQNVNKCYEMASDVCIYGYTIVNNESEKVVVSRSDRHQRVDSVSYKKGLLIQCKRDKEIQGAKKAHADSIAAAKEAATQQAVAEFNQHWFLYTLGMVVATAVVVGAYYVFK